MAVTAIVPLKALAEAKGRLAGVLDGHARRDLVAWMARRVLRACQQCDLITDIVVIAGDGDAAAVAAQTGVAAIVVAEPGLERALSEADARTAGADTTLVVTADLPAVTAEDLAAVIRAAPADGPAVVIVPTHDGGTGALLRRPPTVMGTAYGPGSSTRHARLAAAAGVDPVVVHRAGLASDVDTPDQLPAALALAREQDVGCAPR